MLSGFPFFLTQEGKCGSLTADLRVKPFLHRAQMYVGFNFTVVDERVPFVGLDIALVAHLREIIKS